MCNCMPKYHCWLLQVCFISGSRSPEAFWVELGAAIGPAAPPAFFESRIADQTASPPDSSGIAPSDEPPSSPVLV